MSKNPQWNQETNAEGKPVASPLRVTIPCPDGLTVPMGVGFGATTLLSPGDSAVGSPVVMGVPDGVPHLLTGAASRSPSAPVLPRQSVGDMEKGAMADPEPHNLLTGAASPVVALRQSVGDMEKGVVATPDKS